MNGCTDPQEALSSHSHAGRTDRDLPALRLIWEAAPRPLRLLPFLRPLRLLRLLRLLAGARLLALFSFSASLLLISLLLISLLLISLLASPARAAAASPRSLIESRAALPYGNGIAYETAASVARALARLEALRKGAALLNSDLAARIGTESAAGSSAQNQSQPQAQDTASALSEEARMRALASAVFPVSLLPDLSPALSPAPSSAPSSIQAPKSSDEAAFIARILDSPRDRTQAVRIALHQADNLDLRLLSLERLEAAALEGEELLQRSAANGARPGGGNPFAGRAELLGRELDALEAYLLALRDFDQTWKDPAEAVSLLERLTDLAPGNPLFRMSLGEALLLSERPYEALDTLVTATRLPDAPPRAFYLRGVARLRLHLPANAVDDFSQAIAAKPHKAAWWRARGAARLLAGDEADMCPDFYQACVLGDCEGLAEVRKRGFCQETPPAQSAAPSPASPAAQQSRGTPPLPRPGA